MARRSNVGTAPVLFVIFDVGCVRSFFDLGC